VKYQAGEVPCDSGYVAFM